MKNMKNLISAFIFLWNLSGFAQDSTNIYNDDKVSFWKWTSVVGTNEVSDKQIDSENIPFGSLDRFQDGFLIIDVQDKKNVIKYVTPQDGESDLTLDASGDSNYTYTFENEHDEFNCKLTTETNLFCEHSVDGCYKTFRIYTKVDEDVYKKVVSIWKNRQSKGRSFKD